jgi:hypothetical protein
MRYSREFNKPISSTDRILCIHSGKLLLGSTLSKDNLPLNINVTTPHYSPSAPHCPGPRTAQTPIVRPRTI